MHNPNHSENDETIPVVVGVGQTIDRPVGDDFGLDPQALLIQALEIADKDSGSQFLKQTDSIDIENITSRVYANISQDIIEKFKLTPTRSVYHDVSGDLPVKHLCEAANRIANGLSKVSVICGAESAWSARHARKFNVDLNTWHGTAQGAAFWKPSVDPLVRQYQLHIPVRAYALYENACRSHWHQSFAEAQLETAALQSRASVIASTNEFAWNRVKKSEEEIITASTKNKYLAWPYTKLMVANNYLNSGTAIILTNLRLATELGIDPNKMIYIQAGSYASEADNILMRDNYYHSAAMEAVFNHILNQNDLSMKKIDCAEIYSCFPCVTKMAKQIIDPEPQQDLTITGGMTFCRGQFSNFMSQAIVSMVEKLRIKGTTGILYGNGHYLTHAAGAIISSLRPTSHLLPTELNVQANANARMGLVPDLLEHYEGMATIETYTVVFDRDGLPVYGIIIARTPQNQRFVAKTKEGDSKGYLPLLNTDHAIVGLAGKSRIQHGYNMWNW